MIRNAFIDRRKFLQWGALGGVLAVAGCSGDDKPQEVTTPPVGGGRKMLQKNAEAAEAAKANPKNVKKK
jgi:hypothetical protein